MTILAVYVGNVHTDAEIIELGKKIEVDPEARLTYGFSD
jgi:hypothetical protein